MRRERESDGGDSTPTGEKLSAAVAPHDKTHPVREVRCKPSGRRISLKAAGAFIVAPKPRPTLMV
jgi:hypothetical protein